MQVRQLSQGLLSIASGYIIARHVRESKRQK